MNFKIFQFVCQLLTYFIFYRKFLKDFLQYFIIKYCGQKYTINFMLMSHTYFLS